LLVLDFSNEIFSAVAEDLRSVYTGIQVKGEFDPNPAKFPCVTIDEISNVPTHLDSALKNKYAEVVYRVQVFSNKATGKRAEARGIYATVDETLMELGLFAKPIRPHPRFITRKSIPSQRRLKESSAQMERYTVTKVRRW